MSINLKALSDVRSIPGTLPRVLYQTRVWEEKDDYGSGFLRENLFETSSLDNANLVSSRLYGFATSAMHAPTLDIDAPVFVVPSSTEGHYHLYIDVPMTWWRYKRLLRALAKAGVVEKGYVKASIRRGHSDLRLPWVKK